MDGTKLDFFKFKKSGCINIPIDVYKIDKFIGKGHGLLSGVSSIDKENRLWKTVDSIDNFDEAESFLQEQKKEVVSGFNIIGKIWQKGFKDSMI